MFEIFFTCSKLNYLQFYDICGNKKWKDKKLFFAPSFFGAVVGSVIRYPGWIKIRIRYKHPGYATLRTCFFVFIQRTLKSFNNNKKQHNHMES
jgi:hypothetical protein